MLYPSWSREFNLSTTVVKQSLIALVSDLPIVVKPLSSDVRKDRNCSLEHVTSEVGIKFHRRVLSWCFFYLLTVAPEFSVALLPDLADSGDSYLGFCLLFGIFVLGSFHVPFAKKTTTQWGCAGVMLQCYLTDVISHCGDKVEFQLSWNQLFCLLNLLKTFFDSSLPCPESTFSSVCFQIPSIGTSQMKTTTLCMTKSFICFPPGLIYIYFNSPFL